MAETELRLLKAAAVHWPEEDVDLIPDYTRGVYFLYKQQGKYLNVVYVGRATRTGMKGRIKSHSKSKVGKWTHFSAYEVHDNITAQEIEEIEALFITAYANDSHANKLNVQKGNRKLKKIRDDAKKNWT